MDDVLQMDFREYRLLWEAKALRDVDRMRDYAAHAFLINKASLRKKGGKLLYPSVDSLYDSEKALKSIRKKKTKSAEDPRLEAYKRFLMKRKEEEHG